jgi:hypothetical protein
MSCQYEFEIADVADPKPTRGTNRKKIEVEIPIYEEEYAKLNINTTCVSNPRSNLPVNVTNDPMKTLRNWLRDSDYADFAQYTNIKTENTLGALRDELDSSIYIDVPDFFDAFLVRFRFIKSCLFLVMIDLMPTKHLPTISLS